MLRPLRLFAVSFIAGSALGAAALIPDLPVKTIDGRQYHYHVVQPKETIYSLCINLGITKERLIELNPDVADGLKAGTVLLFPLDGKAPEQPAAQPVANPVSHTVQPQETFYSIARRYGLSVPQLQEWNPEAVTLGLQPGMVLRLVAPAVAPQVADQPAKERRHTVQSGETFYSIAHSYGITVAELEAANPEVGLLRAGDELVIPAKDSPVIASGSGSGTKGATIGSTEPATPVPAPAPAEVVPDTINIAVILPFMAQSDNRQRPEKLKTEFYQGFLLAVDSMRNAGSRIIVQAYDTEGSSARLESILDEPALAKAQVIIAPDNDARLHRIAAYGQAHRIPVLNLFGVRDNSYMTNPMMMQANIPHDRMYSRAVSGVATDMRHRTPVILKRVDGPDDKREFVEMLTAKLTADNQPFQVIEYSEALTVADLEPLLEAEDGLDSFGFIPVSSKQAELNMILPALIEFKNRIPGFETVRLYGYPEWTAFRGETLANMHKANTYVYSRFFTVPDDPGAELMDSRFEQWYGVPMAPGVPRQGLFGFDTGMYLIRALQANHGDFSIATPAYTGVQNGFDFFAPDGAKGLVNDCLYFVNFRPSGLIDRIVL